MKKLQWPWMKKTTHEKKLSEARQAHTQNLRQLQTDHTDEVNKTWAPILKQYFDVMVYWEPKNHDIKVEYTVDSRMLLMLPGHDQRLFAILARQLTGQMERELSAIHFSSIREGNYPMTNHEHSVRTMHPNEYGR